MVDNLPAVWDKPAHTSAKHQILKAYLNAWMPIMSRQSQRVGTRGAELLFVDGFAGPGFYSGGEDGSPILAIRSVLRHSAEVSVPISFLFIEEDMERHNFLQARVKALSNEMGSSRRINNVMIEHGDCETVLSRFLADRKNQGRAIGPALFYLDQFGYSDISMNLIQRIMAEPQCEVFSYLNWDHLGRFLSDQSKWASITTAFGGDHWRPVLDVQHEKRASFVLKAYSDSLKTKGGSRYTWQFAMCDTADSLLYWLFFCTNSLRGLEEMKRAMWQVDPSGGFRFSDRDDPSQLRLFKSFTEGTLADEIASAFSGKTVTIGEIKEFVLTQTPGYLFKRSLNTLEVEKNRLQAVNPPPGRRKGTFSDEQMLVRFVAG
jgi:three-Cys-motif partner protein